jgi:hypothetical protein
LASDTGAGRAAAAAGRVAAGACAGRAAAGGLAGRVAEGDGGDPGSDSCAQDAVAPSARSAIAAALARREHAVMTFIANLRIR